MSTITNPDIVRTLLENEGVYPGDPQMAIIYRYTNPGPPAHKCYAIFLHRALDDMWMSPHVVDPVLLMEDGQLTAAGHDELKQLSEGDHHHDQATDQGRR